MRVGRTDIDVKADGGLLRVMPIAPGNRQRSKTKAYSQSDSIHPHDSFPSCGPAVAGTVSTASRPPGGVYSAWADLPAVTGDKRKS
jgi:hypothetical protein